MHSRESKKQFWILALLTGLFYLWSIQSFRPLEGENRANEQLFSFAEVIGAKKI